MFRYIAPGTAQVTPGCGNRLLDLQLAFRRIKRARAIPGFFIGLLGLGQKKDGSPGPGQFFPVFLRNIS